MSSIWSFFRKQFQAAKESTPANPFIHEVIERSTDHLDEYKRWKDQQVRQRLSAWILDQYKLFKLGLKEIDEAIDFLDTPSSKGFAIHFFKTRYTSKEARYFLDFLQEQVRAIPYRIQVADIRTYERADWVETIERYFLKPPPDFSDPKQFKQGFGNVRIELLFRNEKPFQLRFSATTYKDHLFEEPEEFQHLMEVFA